MTRVVWNALLCLWASVAGAQSESSIGEVLASLRRSGIDVIYSTDLVNGSMPLVAPLKASEPLERAREALAPYGLTLQNVGANRYVVRRTPTQRIQAPLSPVATVVTEKTAPLEEISVYASQYTLGVGETGEPKSLSSVDIDRIPGDDANALRATRLLPGVASNGSSRAYIRGSSLDDVLIQFDGVSLSDPFHMKDFQSLLSAFDTAAIDRMDVYSGGFPVRYGTRSAAVIDVTPRSLQSGYECTIGASRFAYEMSSVGHASQLPLDWMATIRRNAPDLARKPGDGRIPGEPQFTETVGRVRWHPDPGTAWSVGWLLLDDRTSLTTKPAQETATARYRDEYVWTAFDTGIDEPLRSHTVLALSDAGRLRDGSLKIGGAVSGHVDDDRSFTRAELRSDWSFNLSPRMGLDYGVEASRAHARLQYNRTEHFQGFIARGFGLPIENSLSDDIGPEEVAYATWGAMRRRWASLEAEIGVRFDGQDYSAFGARQQWSPRLNVRYDFESHWHLYGSWGHFTQAQRPEEWRIDSAQVRPDLPELAIHSTLGLAYESSQQTRFGLEVYRKRWTHVSPYYDNTLEKLTLVPDLIPDRVLISPRASQSVGVELSAHRAFSATLDGWASYAWSRVTDDFSNTSVLRSWDQPHALSSGVTWKTGPVSSEVVVGWHRGWPSTPFTFIPGTHISRPGMPGSGTHFSSAAIVVGPRNSLRWGNFFTLDLRSSWVIPFDRSELSIWAEAINSTNRRNPCCDRFLAPDDNQDTAITERNAWFARAFDIGFTWRFHARR